MESGFDEGKMSTGELLRKVMSELRLLAKKEIALAKTESKVELRAQLSTAKVLAAAAVVALIGVNLLVASLVMGLFGWQAGVAIGAVLMVFAGIAGYISWRNRKKDPVPETQKTLKEDVEWLKTTFSSKTP